MPELPEVEVTRRGIDGALRGACIVRVRAGKPLRWPLGMRPAALQGLVIGALARRGKYLWMPLTHGDGRAAGGLLWHLGMSGSLSLPAPGAPAGRHDHFDLVTDRGTLRLTDPRRFGAVVYSRRLDAAPAARLLGKLGAEPFDPALTPAGLHAALQRRRAPVKAVLLAGDVVVGAGNIYACEALFAAGIHPALRADRISRPRAARLLAALRATLQRALEVGGSTLRDYSDAHGVAGAFQSEAAVYGREGQPCPRCAAPIRRRVMGQRSTYYCAHCQKR
ncbi:MAG: bifunctional DNA-formamidopyrimidine glycosylase/DNA-(apurinic or apyrimidinic site) lyase [Proteobacteria bacterium]|nr:bifunctional DNA-formamidopyrimidine glycosylase/DNA-(apurinic or apyrimidinic site) lyase [Pseudomonadota bacterium]HOL36632.1 bifunctional DNA-formamidopyrimidine glycosylase/DNA-(apurinic or apyrimidinic site) lyase [Rubrivivax sp.]